MNDGFQVSKVNGWTSGMFAGTVDPVCFFEVA
jgi:hypothetical protein